MQCKVFDHCPSNQPNSPMFPCIQSLWQALQRAVALFPPPNLHRTSRTDRGLAELAPRCGSFLAIGRCKHSKGFVHYPRAAVIVPFRRLPTHSTVSVIFPPFALADRIATFGLDMAYHRPTHIPDVVPFPSPSLLHSAVRRHLPAHNSVQVS